MKLLVWCPPYKKPCDQALDYNDGAPIMAHPITSKSLTMPRLQACWHGSILQSAVLLCLVPVGRH